MLGLVRCSLSECGTRVDSAYLCSARWHAPVSSRIRKGKGMAPPTQPGACDGTVAYGIEEREAGETPREGKSQTFAKLRFAFVGGFARFARLP
jgi:hypothetical protein